LSKTRICTAEMAVRTICGPQRVAKSTCVLCVIVIR